MTSSEAILPILYYTKTLTILTFFITSYKRKFNAWNFISSFSVLFLNKTLGEVQIRSSLGTFAKFQYILLVCTMFCQESGSNKNGKDPRNIECYNAINVFFIRHFIYVYPLYFVIVLTHIREYAEIYNVEVISWAIYYTTLFSWICRTHCRLYRVTKSYTLLFHFWHFYIGQ